MIHHIIAIVLEAVMVALGVLLWMAVGWWLGVIVAVLGTVLVLTFWNINQNAAEYQRRR